VLARASIVFPRLRLGQILVNAVPLHADDLFYASDADLARWIRAYIDEQGSR
jgi:hypothetical protein